MVLFEGRESLYSVLRATLGAGIRRTNTSFPSRGIAGPVSTRLPRRWVLYSNAGVLHSFPSQQYDSLTGSRILLADYIPSPSVKDILKWKFKLRYYPDSNGEFYTTSCGLAKEVQSVCVDLNVQASVLFKYKSPKPHICHYTLLF